MQIQCAVTAVGQLNIRVVKIRFCWCISCQTQSKWFALKRGIGTYCNFICLQCRSCLWLLAWLVQFNCWQATAYWLQTTLDAKPWEKISLPKSTTELKTLSDRFWDNLHDLLTALYPGPWINRKELGHYLWQDLCRRSLHHRSTVDLKP